MIISKRLTQLIRKGKPAVGMWLNLCDPGVAQIAAVSGYDWVMIDNEHNPLTEAQVQGLLHALGGYDVQSVVRVRANREEHVKWVLDCGAGGIIVPGIRDISDARHAVELSKYSPAGNRGYGPNRATGYWARGNEYTADANESILLICHIELASAVADIGDICRLDGVDGVWIGQMDLAQSLGHLEDPKHPDVQAAVDRIIEAANKNNKPWGIPTALIEDYESYVKRGGTIMTLGSDTRLLRSSATELVAAARKASGAA